MFCKHFDANARTRPGRPLKGVCGDCMVEIQVPRALALLLTLVLGMFARPAQGGVAHAQDHGLEAAEPGNDVANHERRPTVVQRFERPRMGTDTENSELDGSALLDGAAGSAGGPLLRRVTVRKDGALAPQSNWRTPERSRGPPVAHR
jgi:hypothetical protein